MMRLLIKLSAFYALTLSALIVGSIVAGSALAAEVTNNGAADIVVLVTEDGRRSEMMIAAGQKLSFCEAGCFVTLPNGDRHALIGTEIIEISDGSVTLN